MICRVTLEFIILFQYNFLNKVSWRLKFCLFYLTQNLFPWIVSPKQFHKLPNCLQSKTQFLWPNWLRLIVRRNFSSPQVVKLLSLRGLQARYMANQRDPRNHLKIAIFLKAEYAQKNNNEISLRYTLYMYCAL